ncbi:Sperm-tail PG-rich repeat-containing protein [Schistosoma japonicum]|nr:Sperm-tail PG-rich repeat-containing protein [Schistosoma japonicum]
MEIHILERKSSLVPHSQIFNSIPNEVNLWQAPSIYAPNSYNIDDGITHHLIVPRLDKCVGFGSTAKRLNDKLLFSRKSSDGQGGIPGPGEYNPQKYDEKNASKAVGIPKAKRETSMPISSVPPPGTYDFGKSFDVTQCKRTPAIPSTVEGRERRNCFSNTAERFGKNSALGPKDPDMPGRKLILKLV